MMTAVSSAALRLTSAQNTFAPSRAKATAAALPFPQPGPIEPAPTTSATLPLRRSAMFPPPLLVHHTQFGFQDFPVVILRQRVDEDIILRPLEACDRVETKRVEFPRGSFTRHIGHHHLAPFLVRPPDHGD